MVIYECKAIRMKNIVKCLNADCDSFCRLFAFVFLPLNAFARESMLLVKGEENFIIKIASFSRSFSCLPLSLHIVMRIRRRMKCFVCKLRCRKNNKNKKCERDAIKIIFLPRTPVNHLLLFPYIFFL